MSLFDAIRTFNETAKQPIELRPTRDGRVTAVLPQVGQEVLVAGSQFKADVRVGPKDVALVCQEARRSMAPALALMDAALAVLDEQPAAAKPAETS